MRVIIVHILILATGERQIRCIWSNDVDWGCYYLSLLPRKKLTRKYVRADLFSLIREETWGCSLKIDSELCEKIERDMFGYGSASIVSVYELEL